MKIAVFHNLGSGGARRVVDEHSRRLEERGHSIVRFDPVDAPPLSSGLRSLAGYAAAKKFHRRNARRINDSACDVVYLHTCVWTGAPYAARDLKSPSLYFCQEPYFDRILEQWKTLDHAPSRGRPLYRIWMKRRRTAERETIRRIGRVLVNAHHMKEEVQNLWGRPVTVCPLGVDADRFRPMNLDRRHTVLSVGALIASKGARFLVEAVARIPEKERPPLILVANTVNEYERRAVEDLARRHGVALTIHHAVAEDDLIRLYNESRLMVYAPVREPLGLAALEAMACGLAVVGINEGGVRETVIDGETGLLAGRDAGAFGEAIAQLLGDAPRRERLGRQAREHVVERWTWKRSVDVLEQELAACVAGL